MCEGIGNDLNHDVLQKFNSMLCMHTEQIHSHRNPQKPIPTNTHTKKKKPPPQVYLDLDLVEGLAVVHTANAANHLGHDDHVTDVRLDDGGLLLHKTNKNNKEEEEKKKAIMMLV